MKFKCNRCRKIFATRHDIKCEMCKPTRSESHSSNGTMLTEVNHPPNWMPATEYTIIRDSSWSGGGGNYGGGGSGGSWSDGGSSDSGSSGGGGGGD